MRSRYVLSPVLFTMEDLYRNTDHCHRCSGQPRVFLAWIHRVAHTLSWLDCFFCSLLSCFHHLLWISKELLILLFVGFLGVFRVVLKETILVKFFLVKCLSAGHLLLSYWSLLALSGVFSENCVGLQHSSPHLHQTIHLIVTEHLLQAGLVYHLDCVCSYHLTQTGVTIKVGLFPV